MIASIASGTCRGRLAFRLVLLLLLAATACGSPGQSAPGSAPTGAGAAPSPAAPAAARRLVVVATTTQIQDFVRNVGGERVEVLGISPPDADAHAYQPTAEDARKMGRADVVFSNGVQLEPWFESLSKNARSGVPVVSLAVAAKLRIRGAEGGDQGRPGIGDPHVWFDPTNVQKMVDVIGEALAAAEPPGASIYAANAASYRSQLAALDAQIKQEVERLPRAQRKLVTNHETFGYYADRYGFEVVGSVIPSVSTEAEPSAADLQALAAAIKAQNVKAIFMERSGNPRLEQQLAQQAGVKVVSSLYGDALGPPGSDGDTYITMMQFNTREIVQGLT